MCFFLAFPFLLPCHMLQFCFVSQSISIFFKLISDFTLLSFHPSTKMQFSSSSCQPRPTSLQSFLHLVLFFFPAAVSHQYFRTCHPPLLSSLVSFAPSLLLHLPRSERLSATPLRVCEPLGLNDFLLPPPVNSAPFDQANEIENFHLSQIDFKPEITCDSNEEQQQEEGTNAEMPLSLNTKQLNNNFYMSYLLQQV